MAAKLAIVDFETDAIANRPAYPPEPVGVSIKTPGQTAHYFAWGHPTGNNCDKSAAVQVLKNLWRSDTELVFHNAAFDIAVAWERLSLPLLPWHRIHDTMILAFLHDPHASTISLKPLAEKHLNMPSTERDDLREWILQYVPEARRAQKQWGAHIAKAPGQLVARYSDGDTTRTQKLLEFYLPKLDEGMRKAYDRERQLLPILLENEKAGICVSVKRLQHDCKLHHATLDKVTALIKKRLKADDSVNIDSDEELADCLEKAGKVTEWILTPKGNRSTAADNLARVMTDKVLLGALTYRGALQTCLGTFMDNWLAMAEASKGRIHCRWNQVRDERKKGSRTGRMSSTPNFLNIPTELEKINQSRPKGFPELPTVRSYIVPDGDDCIIIDRDYNGQEMRIFAHFEDGKLQAAYQANHWLDPHQLVTDELNDMLSLSMTRKAGKTIDFGILYGEGVGKLAIGLGTSVDEARRARNAYYELFPGAKELVQEMRLRAKANQPIRTIGGRLYYCEPPQVLPNGRVQEYDYKLINYLIQGSGADVTKQSIINYHQHPKRRGRWLLAVHDENAASAEKKRWKPEMLVLKESMEAALVDSLDVPLLTNGSFGPNYHELEDLPNGQ